MTTDHAGMATAPPTIAVAATFTAEPLDQPLAFWMQELDMSARVVFAPYNQVFQELLNPAGLLAGNRQGINIVLVRLEDWQKGEPSADGSGAETADARGRIARNAQDLVRALTVAAGRSPAFHLLFLCPASPAQTSDSEGVRFLQQMEDRIASALADVGGVHVVTSAELAAAYPVAQPHDPHGDDLAHNPYARVFFTALATMIARKIYALRTARPKVVVFDADQTLWGGLCGEDGPLGIRLDPAHRAVQEFLVRQCGAGRLLCLCSKNNEEDVAQVFERRPEMPLHREHLVAWRVNWRPKSENLKSLARELRLGLDSLIFIDDDPVECAEVQANCPEVLTLLLPREPEQLPRFLRNIWAFDCLKTTPDARERTALYQQDLHRQRAQKESLTLKDFLAGLGLRIQITAMALQEAGRVAELTQRTNQFNVATIRRSEAEIQRLCGEGGLHGLVVRAKDRFGDYGLVGVILYNVAAAALAVDTFLLSCRALGRGIEHRMLARLGELARQEALATIDVPFTPTGKNQPALNFLDGIAGGVKLPRGNGFVFRVPADVAAAVRYQPPDATSAEGAATEALPPSPAPAEPIVDKRVQAALLRSIAEELSDVEQIHGLIAAAARERPALKTPFVAPRTPIEQKLADMCSAILGVERVGVDDSFFDLGGHSLLATQVLARMRDAFQVELSPRVLFTGRFTVADLAKTVAKHQVQQAEPLEVAAVLQKLNELSDDEVRKLLGGGAL